MFDANLKIRFDAMKVQKTLSFCFVKYAACACCLHLFMRYFQRREISFEDLNTEFHRDRIAYSSRVEFSRKFIDLQFSLATKISPKPPLAPLIHHPSKYFVRYFARYFYKRFDSNTIRCDRLHRSHSTSLPSLDHRAIRRTTVRSIAQTQKKLCYLFAITITRVHDTRVTNRIYLAIHRFELFFKPFFLDRLKKKEVGGEKKKRNRFREGTRRAEALNSRNPSRGHGGH